MRSGGDRDAVVLSRICLEAEGEPVAEYRAKGWLLAVLPSLMTS